MEVPLRYSARALRPRLVVGPDRLPEVVVPLRTSLREVDRMIDEHRGWLGKQLANAAEPVLELEYVRLGQREGRRRARAEIEPLARLEAEELGLEFERITIRDQRTRWGSCSTSGTLSFNWRLVLAPYEVLDYVVVHELCHLAVHDHSRRFWRLVERARPEYREQRDWLARHGWELLAYRPPR